MLSRSLIFATQILTSMFIALLSASAQAQKPAITKSIDEPGRTPYISEIKGNCDGSCSVAFKAVPAGFRLVATYIGASYISIPNASGPSLASLDGGPAFLYLPTVAPVTNNGVTRFFVLSSPIVYYVESGLAPRFNVGNSGSFTASLFGYLVAVD
jgi:hypothetical protein